jgi:hypothetical protein
LNAIEPTDQIQTMLAVILVQIAPDELRFHRTPQLPMPAALNLDDYRHDIQFLTAHLTRYRINLDVCSLAPCFSSASTNYYFTIHNDSSIGKLVL